MTKKTFLQLTMLLSAIIGVCIFACGWYATSTARTRVSVPVSAKELHTNDRILKEDIAFRDIDPESITPDMVTNPNSLVNNYILRDTAQDEYFYASWISEDIYKRLAERAVYGAVAASTDMLKSVNGEIKPDDFVMITIIAGDDKEGTATYNGDMTTDGLPTGKVKLIEPPELSAVRVLGIVDGSGIDINDKRELVKEANGQVSPDSSLAQGSMIIFDCDSVQRAFILQAQYSGTLQITILPEAEQEVYRQKWGLSKKVSEDGQEISNTENPTTTPSAQMTPEQIEERKKQLTELSKQNTKEELLAKAKELNINLTDKEAEEMIAKAKGE